MAIKEKWPVCLMLCTQDLPCYYPNVKGILCENTGIYVYHFLKFPRIFSFFKSIYKNCHFSYVIFVQLDAHILTHFKRKQIDRKASVAHTIYNKTNGLR